MKVLVACEESQTVCKAFREKGHEAYSCDIIDCSGGHPEWHIKQDVLPLLNGNCEFKTVDRQAHTIKGKWDLIIAHPPCTFMSKAGARWMFMGGKLNIERYKKAMVAKEFFMEIWNADCEKIVIENPIGIMSSEWKKPNQIIQPYQFGHPQRKSTCLWLKGMTKLMPTEIVEPEIYYYTAKNGKIKSDSRWRSQCKKEDRAKHRSKTFPGIAKAMAEQWG